MASIVGSNFDWNSIWHECVLSLSCHDLIHLSDCPIVFRTHSFPFCSFHFKSATWCEMLEMYCTLCTLDSFSFLFFNFLYWTYTKCALSLLYFTIIGGQGGWDRFLEIDPLKLGIFMKITPLIWTPCPTMLTVVKLNYFFSVSQLLLCDFPFVYTFSLVFHIIFCNVRDANLYGLLVSSVNCVHDVIYAW